MVVKEKLTREEEERIWTISAIAIVPILIGSMVYMIALVRPSFTMLILYAFSFSLPVSICICCATYEILFSLKVKKPFLFHIKRFLSRMIFVLGFVLAIILFWGVLNLFLSPLISDKNTLLISFVTLTMIVCVFAIISKTRDFLIKFFSGEW